MLLQDRNIEKIYYAILTSINQERVAESRPILYIP